MSAATNGKAEPHTLSLDDLLSTRGDVEERWVELPELGGRVKIRSLTGAEYQEIGSRFARVDDEGVRSIDLGAYYRAVTRVSIVEPADWDDAAIARLWEKKQSALAPLIKAIDALNGIQANAQKEAEALFRQ